MFYKILNNFIFVQLKIIYLFILLKMPEELRLYYYEKDTEKKAYDLPIANYNDYTSSCSDFSYDTVPIYNDKFENVWT